MIVLVRDDRKLRWSRANVQGPGFRARDIRPATTKVPHGAQWRIARRQ